MSPKVFSMAATASTEGFNGEDGSNVCGDAAGTLSELGSTDFGTFESEGDTVPEGGDFTA